MRIGSTFLRIGSTSLKMAMHVREDLTTKRKSQLLDVLYYISILYIIKNYADKTLLIDEE